MVTLTASGATCGAGETPEYRFLYIKDGTSTAVEIRAYGTSATATWNTTGLASGAYRVIVYARAVGSTAAYQSVGYLSPNYLIGDVCNNSTSFTTSPPPPQPVGAMISLNSTSTCTGGTAEYRYAYRAPGSSSYVYIGAYGAAAQTWNTAGLPAGAYSLVVYSRAVGNTSTYEGLRYSTYNLGANACSNASLMAAPAAPQPPGTQVTLTGAATCGSPQFRFSYRLFGDAAWINIGTWGGATANWDTTGLASGLYQLLVEARQTGSAGAAETTSIINYALGDACNAVTLSASPPSPQGVGITVALTGSATCTGAATPEYRFSYRAPGSSTYVVISPYGAATANWATTGLPVGAYTLLVEARATGSTSPYESAASQSYTLTSTALTTVAAGLAHHVCARVNDGTARCWGPNDVGQLGNGMTAAMSTTPVTVTGLSNVVSVMAGGFHSCALLADNTVRCWGENSDGQLGNNSNTPSSSPVVVSGLTDAIAISVGTFHACALRSAGTVACWGSNSAFATGSEVAGDWPQTKVPATLPGISGATAVYAGGFHSCALVGGGGLKCWGDNSHGQLGNGGTPVKSITPVDVTGLTSGVTSLGAGDVHNCALVGGGVQCWGDNTYGQIGNGPPSMTPVTTPSVVAGLTTVAQAAAGFTFSCARMNNRTVRCWGRNGSGELGDGTGVDSSTPVTVSGITNAASLSTGSVNACIIPLSGPAMCWGYGAVGTLGNGTSGTDALSPVAVSFP